MSLGIVYLVGAGPGDPKLITLRGKELLESAECVIYDKLVDPILLEHAPITCERIYVGKEAGAAHHCTPQAQINALLLDKARAGKRVVRLKGGDPLLFARGAEEAEVLASANIPYEIVPGVTAALGCAATAAIPLTHRERASAVAFVTGHEDPAKECGLDWDALARFPGTIVVYMGLTRTPAIASRLIQLGKSPQTPVGFVEWGGTNRQRVVTMTLGEASHGSPTALRSPVLAIIGDVVQLRDRLEWFQRRPLFGQRVLVASPSTSAQRLASLLGSLGALVVIEPAISIEALENSVDLDLAQDRLGSFSWLVFTSRPGVEHFFGRLLERGLDLRKLGGIKLAAIGPGTAAALEAFHLRADLIPDAYQAEALAAALGPRAHRQRVLLVRANRGREVLGDELIRQGAKVETVVAYRQVDNRTPGPQVLESLRAGEIDWVFFSSSNIARAFAGWLSEEDAQLVRQKVSLLSISPVTTETIRELGFEVSAEAKTYTLEGMTSALVEAVAIK